MGFGHQGAELLSAKGEKIGVLAIFGGFSSLKLSYFWEFRDETCRKWTLGIYAGVLCVILEFGHQGAKLLSAKGEKMGVFAFFG